MAVCVIGASTIIWGVTPAAAGGQAGALLAVNAVTAAENPGNGDGVLVGGEGGRLTVALENTAPDPMTAAPATAVTATLTTTTPGVTITQPAVQPYADIAVGAIVTNAVPWTFTVPSDASCGLTIDFTLTVTYAGGVASPQVLTFPVQIGEVDITTVLDTVAPVASPSYAATTGTQTGRLLRNGVVSSCTTSKGNPGLANLAGARRYDTYTFNTCSTLPASCAQITLNQPGQTLFSVAYQPSFNPSAPSADWLGDAGLSDPTTSYSVNPGTSGPFTIVVHEVNSNGGLNTTYTLRVGGTCGSTCTRNGVPTAVATNAIIAAGLNGTANVLFGVGSSDPDGDTLTFTQSPAGPYPVGVTPVLLTASDPSGATSQATGSVTVIPAIIAIAPASGPEAGGTVATITGTGFSTTPGATTVMFGATAATGVTCATITECQATAPAGTGTVNVRVIVAGQSSLDGATDDYTYIPAPVVTSIAPDSGPLGGGTIVTISGTGFSTTPGATTVMFGAIAGTSVSCVSTTQCQVTSPPGAAVGTVSVRVVVATQTSVDTAADDFDYATLAYLLAEGATGGFFDEDVLIANPNTSAAPVTLTFFKEDGTTVTDTRTLAAQTQTIVHVDALPGLEETAASVQVVSESGIPLVVERSMFWDSSYYGGHAAGAVNGPAQQWYFAEGSQGFFDTYLLVVNPSPSPASLTLTFLREGEAPVVKTMTMGGTSRLTLHAGDMPELVNRSFAIAVDATQSVIVERAMYFGTTPARLWAGGHASGGSALASQWYYAEGATGGFFDTFILLGNPQSTDAHVQVRYLLDSGDEITVPKLVPANTRLTINAEAEDDARLRDAAFSTVITSDVPIVSERSMYWPGETQPWGEAHNSAGIPQPGTTWGLAEGRVGGPHEFRTYILLGNPQSTAADVTVTYLRASGAPIVKTYSVPATSRFNIDVNADVPELADESFGATIAVTNNVDIIVERSIYWNANGVFWSGGSNATGVRLP